MTLVVELRRGGSPSRSGRRPGARPAAGTLERIVFDDDAFWAAVEGLGRHRVPTLADVDPYGDTRLRGEAVERMVRELAGADLARLRSRDREAMTTLLAWGRRCAADERLRIGFSGD
ncbi:MULTISPECIES: hypothetical protein [unclassified Streptomyces]|uniref:hypothetical protein n=1 Tax=unclassified Streptomyces TaxID=2593676 RepID=UPI0009C2AA57|nr:hypothetical protein [Streptomyces sp. Sge12]ARE72935.1 hypothetical protein B6R96_02450 [Streptomyces sp. Sge12]